MAVAYAVFVLGVVVVAVLAAWISMAVPRRLADARWTRPLAAAHGDVRRDLGAHGGALAILLAAATAAVVVTWPFGRLVRRTQPHVDVPVFRWTRHHLARTGAWEHANAVLTRMGNRPEIKLICVAGAVVFGLIWAVQRRGWWKPLLILAATFGFEKYGQSILKLVVNRGHPPTSAGSFPSGGCARLITVYGIVFYLVLLTWPAIGRRWRVAGWTAVSVLAFVEGYTRVFLFKHWFTDVLAGWLFGALLLLALVAAARCLAAPVPLRPEPPADSLGDMRRERAAAGQPDR